MAKQAFALNLSDYTIEALELEQHHHALQLVRQSSVALNPGIIENGKILDADKLREALQVLIQQAQPAPFTGREVALTVPESRVFVQTIGIPTTVPAKAVLSNLLSQAEHTLPIDLATMTVDYHEAYRTPDQTWYLFAATYTSLVQEYSEFFQSLKLRPVFLTLESIALAAATIAKNTSETVLLIDIGSRTTIASIFRGGILQESINIGIAGNHITDAIAEKMQISKEEAEQKKITTGLKASEHSGAEMLIIQGQLQPLKDELLVFIKYFQQKMGVPVDRVLLAGGSAGLIGIDEYLQSNLAIPTTIAQPLPEFQIDPSTGTVAKFLPTLGLARLALEGGSTQINLLERKAVASTARLSSETGTTAPKPLTTLPSSVRGSSPKLRIILLVALIVLANIVTWLLLARSGYFGSKSVTPLEAVSGTNSEGELANTFNFIIRPFIRSGPGIDKQLSFMFTVSSGAADDATRFKGMQKTFGLRETIQYDAAAVDTARRNMESGVYQGTDLDGALKSLLADRLWSKMVTSGDADRQTRNELLLQAYVSRKILNSTTLPLPTDGSPMAESDFQAEVTGLMVSERAKFEAYESAQISAFTKLNPGYKVTDKAYVYTVQDNGAVDVTAIYNFVYEQQ